MLTVEMLPADHGDCLWIEYGDGERPHRILIDGGTASTYEALAARISCLPTSQRRFDLLVISHIDADHIQGIVRLLQDRALGVVFDDIWFNGWEHVSDLLSPVEGEYLSALLKTHKLKWNTAFDNGPVVVPVTGPLPVITLRGGMHITLLSPTPKQLNNLRAKWETVVRRAGLTPGESSGALRKLKETKRLAPSMLLSGAAIKIEELAKKRFTSDKAVANGSSIAVLAEYNGRSCLLAADAFAPVLAQSITRLLRERGNDRLDIDIFKLPHHGSKSNINAELLALVRCKHYLFSTNGKVFNHPDAEAVARVITYGGSKPQLFFNYRTSINEIWSDADLRLAYSYGAKYPAKNQEGIVVKVRDDYI